MIEKASLNSYYSAYFKKQPVTIVLDSASFSFKSSNKDDTNIVNNNGSASKGSSNSLNGEVSIPWKQVLKHQVSPASHPKCLLKLILKQQQQTGEEVSAITFTFETRDELEAIRRDVTQRLVSSTSSGNEDHDDGVSGSKKRKAEDMVPSSSPSSYTGKPNDTNSFTDISPDMLAVTRATLLANDASLNAQHQLLVKETATLSEEDFWSAHYDQLAEECARIHGKYRKGVATSMRSNLQLQGVVRLGVEEIRQIFVMYPAVHKAYVEKVPLELSEEQFWKKYLESEYFYRDRGRIGQMARTQRIEQQLQLQPKQGKSLSSSADGGEDAEKKRRLYEEQELENSSAPATAAVVSGVDDIFSRYDAELRQQQQKQHKPDDISKGKRDPRTLAVGQFDLASTVYTERSHLGESDLHPDTSSGNLGSLIVQKYNRHWAMVLYPDEHHAAVGGNDYLLRTSARHSIDHALPNDDTPKSNGGYDAEMQRLVSFANCDEQLADHVNGLGDEEFQDLCLKNLDGYYSTGDPTVTTAAGSAALKDLKQRNFLLSKQVADEIKFLAAKSFGISFPLEGNSSKGVSWLPTPDTGTASKESVLPSTVLPLSEVGLPLLKALSKRMGDSIKSDADAQKIADSLPDKFKRQLDSCFRRSSELLRHFFGLRRVIEISKESGREKEKLGKIFNGMEALYKEIEKIRLDLPQSPQGEMMRRMCKPIMDQLDLAFKLHYRGGFVSVGSSNFVSVSLG